MSHQLPLICPACEATYPAHEEICLEDGALLHPNLCGRLMHGRAVESVVGAMGDALVYRVRNVALDRVEALEAFGPLRGVEQIERFRRQARRLGQLRSAHAPRCYDLVMRQDLGDEVIARPLFFRDLVPGVPLDRLLEEGPMSPARAAGVVHQICDALGMAHLVGRVHGALRPARVVLAKGARGEDVAYVLFESRLGRAEPDEGSEVWTAPEQHEGAEPTRRADVYALGLLFSALLTGSNPRDGLPPSLTGLARVQAPIPALPVSEPPGLAELVASMVAIDPAERMSDVQQVRECLEALELVASAEALAEANRHVARLRRRIHPRRGVGVVVGALGLTLAVVALATRGRPMPWESTPAVEAARAPTIARAPAGGGALDLGAPPTSDAGPPRGEAAPPEVDAAPPPPEEVAIPLQMPSLPPAKTALDLVRVNLEGRPDLYVGRTEITRRQWTRIGGARPPKGRGGPDYPVTNVTMSQILAVLNAASKADHLKPCYRCGARGCRARELKPQACDGYRLPSSEEWGAIARVASPSGPPRNKDAIYWSARRKKGAQPVCSKPVDAAGLCDLYGNVWEWTGTRSRKRVWLRFGGSWQHTRDESQAPVGHRNNYAVRYLGARAVRTAEGATAKLGALELDSIARTVSGPTGPPRRLGEIYGLLAALIRAGGGPVPVQSLGSAPPEALTEQVEALAGTLEELHGGVRLKIRDGQARLLGVTE